LSISDHTWLLDQVNCPPWRGISNKLCPYMNFEKSSIAVEKPPAPDRSLKNRTTLKSPQKHHGLSHQLINLAISSHKTLLSPTSLGPYTPSNAHIKLSSALRNETAKVYRPMHSPAFSTTLLSHIIRILPNAPLALI
jgi:hypothetical protein